jgi:hypothetical protein
MHDLSTDIFAYAIPPFVYFGFGLLLSTGGLRMRDDRIMSRQTTPVYYWTFMIVGGAVSLWCVTMLVARYLI